MKTLKECFPSWSAAALAETLAQADKLIAQHAGDIAKARESIAELAGGNVSLQCRAHFQPIEHVLAALERGVLRKSLALGAVTLAKDRVNSSFKGFPHFQNHPYAVY